jgi:hypothetical protein
MKVYKTKLTYEVEFVSVKKPDLYNPDNVHKKLSNIYLLITFQ